MNKMRHEYGDWESALGDVAEQMKSESVALTTTIVMDKMIADQVADFDANLNREETTYAPPILLLTGLTLLIPSAILTLW